MDSEEEIENQYSTKIKKKTKVRQCMNFFGSYFSQSQKTIKEERKNYKYEFQGQFKKVRILSSSCSEYPGSTPSLSLQVVRHLGFVDVTIYRRIYIDQD